jgi:ligand-binding sensor domain-containing protein/DNA-binding CsgD family transcriptional regulator
MIRKVFFYLLFLFTQVCFGQDSSSLYFDHLTISDGLSHNTIFCILQDHDGYIWVGTQNGLNKYDGYSFEVYRSNELENDEMGFVGKHISSLYEDKNGNLWVGTKKNGINFRAKSSDRFINLQADSAFIAISGFDITSFFEDQTGNIWITTVGAGVLKYNPETSTSKIYNQENSNLSSDVSFDMVEDKYGTVWVATAGGGINYMLNDSQFELSHEMLPNHPNMGGYRKKMFLDDEYLWVGTEGTGLYKMNLKDRSYIHFAPGNGKRSISSDVVKDIFKAEDGKLFIATDGEGLNIYDSATEDISIYNYQIEEKTALNSSALLCLWGDRTGNIWIGTYNGGLNIYKPNKTWFDYFSPSLLRSNELQHRSVLSIFQSENDEILIGTDGGGLNWLNKNNDDYLPPSFKHDPTDPTSIAGNVVKTIFKDSQNRLWIGLFGKGLDLYNSETKSFQHIIGEPINIWSIAEKKDGKLLIATMGNGIRVLDPTTQEITFFHPELTEKNIMTVFVDKENQIWVGTAENGLDIWDEGTKQFVHYKHDYRDSFSISNNEIREIFQDSKGGIWIGTEGGGLNRWLGNGRFERIGTKNGLIANSVMGITEDKDGMIWVTTFEGISQINQESKVVRNFDFRTFQNTNQFNQNSILTGSGGKLFFGGINGLNTILPEKVKEKKLESEILFTDLRIYNKSIPLGELPDGRVILKRPIENSSNLWLSYLDQSFSIDFIAIDYTNPLENEFAYQMEGFDDNWQLVSAGQRSATYTNLDPGTYVFKVKHKEKVASIIVNIKPPYWQTIWFRSLVLIFSLGLLFSGLFFWIKRREAASKRKILQLQNEKLATEVEAKNSKLMFSSVQMAHKNEILTEVKKDLINLQKTPENNLRPLVRKLDRELKNEDYWEEFNLYFNEVDQRFIDKILEKYPELTKNDLRLCSLLRMNLSTKEIASLLNISTRAVEQSRYRLKKRLNLDKEEDLSKFITCFNS